MKSVEGYAEWVDEKGRKHKVSWRVEGTTDKRKAYAQIKKSYPFAKVVVVKAFKK